MFGAVVSMVYVWVLTVSLLLARSVEKNFRVVVTEMLMVDEYWEDEVVGVVPSVV